MRYYFLLIFLLSVGILNGQDIVKALNNSIKTLQADTQFKNAAISLYVVDANTGKPVFEFNPELGLAPASCQKIATSVSTFEMLGKDFFYKTTISADGKIVNGVLQGNLIITGFGDPSFGSWRWAQTKTDVINKAILDALRKSNIKTISGSLIVDDMKFGYQSLPDGWIWQDIGNYYGAGASGFNWNENQFDVSLKASNIEGGSTQIIATSPIDNKNEILNFITTGKKGTGDNAYLYSTPYNKKIFATGTIPLGENKFTISGSMPMPAYYFADQLKIFLTQNSIEIVNDCTIKSGLGKEEQINLQTEVLLDAIASPPLDSLNFWFLRKSVNIYGEAFVKTIAWKSNPGKVSTDSGVSIIKKFWSQNGIEPSALNIIDGSGLSPANRITTKSLVTILQFAKAKSWFASFYNALPTMNNIKMKDGYINGVRSYTGYVKSKAGKEYSFSFIINNFYGSAGTVREKMWKLLDLLK